MSRFKRMELSNSTVFIKTANAPGKTILIMAGVHGNETCGVLACEKALKEIEIEKGKLIWIYANKKALERNTRFAEYNLNRCFLPDQNPEMAVSLEGKTARELMPYLDEADVLLDLHASYTPQSRPFIICDEANAKDASNLPAESVLVNIDPFHPGSTDAYMNMQNTEDSLNCIASSGNIENPRFSSVFKDRSPRHPLDGEFCTKSDATNRILRKPAFCMECGYLGDPSCIAIGERAIRCFLVQQGMISGTLKTNKQSVYKVQSIYKNILEPFKKNRVFSDFEIVPQGTCIGREGKKEILSEKGDVLLFVRDAPGINEECFLIAKELT